jgi:hypothetical protein
VLSLADEDAGDIALLAAGEKTTETRLKLLDATDDALLNANSAKESETRARPNEVERKVGPRGSVRVLVPVALISRREARELIGWLVLRSSSPFPAGNTRTHSARRAHPLPASYMNTQEDRDEDP